MPKVSGFVGLRGGDGHAQAGWDCCTTWGDSRHNFILTVPPPPWLTLHWICFFGFCLSCSWGYVHHHYDSWQENKCKPEGFVVWGELIIDRSIGRWCFFSGHAKCIGLLLICKSLSQLTLDQPGHPKGQSQPADFVSTEASPPANPNPAWGTWMTKCLRCWLWKSGSGAVLISIIQFSPCVLLLVAFSWLVDSEENSWNLTDASTLMNYIMDSWVLNFVWTKRKLFHFSCCAHPSSTCPVVFLGLSRETASILARWMQLPRRQRVKLVAVLMVKIYLDSLRQLGSWFICLRKNCLNIIHTKGLQCEHWTSLSSPGVKKKRRNKLEDQVEIDAFSAFGTSH